MCFKSISEMLSFLIWFLKRLKVQNLTLTDSRQSIIVVFCSQTIFFKRLQYDGEEIITIYQQILKCEIKLCRAWENCIILYNMYTQ